MYMYVSISRNQLACDREGGASYAPKSWKNKVHLMQVYVEANHRGIYQHTLDGSEGMYLNYLKINQNC